MAADLENHIGLIFSEVYTLVLAYAEGGTIQGVPTFNPDILPQVLKQAGIDLDGADAGLEDKRYLTAYRLLVESAALSVYALLTLRAGFTDKIIDQMENEKHD